MPKRKVILKTIGIGILLIPSAILALFGFGEVFGGNISGLQHFLQLLPLVILAVVSWKHPNIGGKFLIALGILVFMIYPFTMLGRFPWWAILVNDFIIFLPAIVSGFFILLSTGENFKKKSKKLS